MMIRVRTKRIEILHIATQIFVTQATVANLINALRALITSNKMSENYPKKTTVEPYFTI